MSVEKSSEAAAAGAGPAAAASDASAIPAASGEAAAVSAEAPHIAPSATADDTQKASAPAEPSRTAEIMIFDPVFAASQERAPEKEAGAGHLRHLPLAASIALAAVLGGLAGAAATAHWSHEAAPPAANAQMTEATRALDDRLAQLGAEMTTLKTSMAVVQRNTGLQSGKLGERLERLEKAQVEPYAKIARACRGGRSAEEHRPVPAAAPPAAAAHSAAQSAAPATGDVTGTVAPAGKKETQPLYAEGWRLRDYYYGRAVVENPNGRMFEIGPGSNLPGLGRVDAIKREDGRIVVVTRNGLIAASEWNRGGCRCLIATDRQPSIHDFDDGRRLMVPPVALL